MGQGTRRLLPAFLQLVAPNQGPSTTLRSRDGEPEKGRRRPPSSTSPDKRGFDKNLLRDRGFETGQDPLISAARAGSDRGVGGRTQQCRF